MTPRLISCWCAPCGVRGRYRDFGFAASLCFAFLTQRHGGTEKVDKVNYLEQELTDQIIGTANAMFYNTTNLLRSNLSPLCLCASVLKKEKVK